MDIPFSLLGIMQGPLTESDYSSIFLELMNTQWIYAICHFFIIIRILVQDATFDSQNI